MRKLRVLICIFFAISCVIYGLHTIKSRVAEDKNAPTISFEESELVINLADGEVDLLQGVSASDKEDGDLTDMVQVASLSLMEDGKRTVKYIVFDKANNPGTAQRTISYSDYRAPRMYIKEPFRFEASKVEKSGAKFDVIAQDVLDGDISEKVGITYQTGFSPEIGTYDVTFYVQNSAGDSCQVPVKVTVYDGKSSVEAEKYYPVLSDYILYLKKGTTLDFSSYVTGISNKSTTYVFGAAGTPANITKDKVVIDASKVDYETAGVYEVTYSYTTLSGVRAVTNAYVVVED